VTITPEIWRSNQDWVISCKWNPLSLIPMFY
jgi:hypothetical protein